MVYPSPFIRLSWLFAVNGTDEIAETSVAIRATTPTEFLDQCITDPLIQTAFDTEMRTFLGASSNAVGFADYGRLVGNRVAAISTTGAYLAPPSYWAPETAYAGNRAQVLPQASVVLSLRCGLGATAGRRGRMYIPYTKPTLAAGANRIDVDTLGFIADAAVALLDQVNVTADLVLADSAVCVAAQTEGSLNGVTTVRVGDVVDTQRRRRNQIPETYTERILD